MNHIEHTKYRKALFDFTGQNQDEISFRIGDVIAVIDEIDVGWWLGEIHQKRGIFPVNYTEEYDPHTQPLPPLPVRHETSAAALKNESSPLEQLQLPQEQQKSLPELNATTHPLTNPRVVDLTYSPPVLDHHDAAATTTPTHASIVSSTSTRRPPPPPVTTSSPAVTTLRSGSLSRKRSTAIRAPPPPPTSVRTANHTIEPSISSTTASPVITESPHIFAEGPPTIESTAPLPALTSSPPQSLHENHHDAAPAVLDEPCNECECHEFIENVFKKGYCNNCFHKHHE